MKLAVALMLVVGTAFAGPAQRVARRVRAGTEVFQTRMESREPLPQAILDAAKCIASVKVVKAGFIFGGEGSVGLVSCRTRDGWSTPSFLNIGGASFGLQIGGQVVESVLVFLSDYSRQVLATGTVKLGADISIAAGPVGAGVGIGAIPNAHVLSYSRAVGLFAGLTVNGLVVGHAPLLNEEAYGRLTPREILGQPARLGPAIVQTYVDALRAYTN